MGRDHGAFDNLMSHIRRWIDPMLYEQRLTADQISSQKDVSKRYFNADYLYINFYISYDYNMVSLTFGNKDCISMYYGMKLNWRHQLFRDLEST